MSSERESAAAASSTKTRDQAVDVSMLSDPTDVDSVTSALLCIRTTSEIDSSDTRSGALLRP